MHTFGFYTKRGIDLFLYFWNKPSNPLCCLCAVLEPCSRSKGFFLHGDTDVPNSIDNSSDIFKDVLLKFLTFDEVCEAGSKLGKIYAFPKKKKEKNQHN